MKTITSISGGKTSAYMAIYHPTDRNIFAAVLSRDPACVIADQSLRRYCEDKLPWFDWDTGGSRELDLTLSNLRELEQELGTEIEWVSSPFTFEDVIMGTIDPGIARAYARSVSASAMLPNKAMRFCTQALKLYPMAWHTWLSADGDPCLMHIGFRSDEPQRVEKWGCDGIKLPTTCDLDGQFKGKHRWENVDYRMVRFPLYEDGVTNTEVRGYWSRRGWSFPTVSNCDGCFFHKSSEHRHQAKFYPERMQWWSDMEKTVGATFASRSVDEILHDSQLSLFEDGLDQFACNCTD
jgi:hypothetical protein